MAKVGRNDPCPCGSGRKYKHCHGRQERAQQAAARTTHHEYVELLDTLLTYGAVRPETVADVDAAIALFWNGDYGAGSLEAADHIDRYRFMEWFTFDYVTTRGDRKRLIEIFAEERGLSLSELKQNMLAKWQNSPLSLFRVLDVVPGRSFLVEDLLLGGEQRVAEDLLTTGAAQGDLVLGRLLETPGDTRFSIGPILLPSSIEEGMVQFIEKAWQNYQDAHYGADKTAFLLDSGYLMNHYLVRRAQDGQGRPSSGRKYHNLTKSLKAMEEAREKELEAEEEELRELEELGMGEERPLFQEIAGGRLLIPGEEPAPEPKESERTAAGGKILLP